MLVGDVVGGAGRRVLRKGLKRLREEFEPDLVVVNGENAAGGFGITEDIFLSTIDAGADVVTTGNHVWDQKQFVEELPDLDYVLRPHNYPPGAPGRGFCVVEADGERVLVLNVMGRLFLNAIDDPFRAADAVLEANPDVRISLCDMHGEATSEKVAMGWYLDGRVSAVVGTHTHVPTADERVLPGGTAYVTDVGMVGPRDGVIGVDKEAVLKRFLTGVPHRFEVADGPVTFNSVLVTIDRPTGRAIAIQRNDQVLT